MYPLKFVPFPELHTERLHLRELCGDDVEAIFSLKTHPKVNTYINRPPTTRREDARYFINTMINGDMEGKWVYWGICLKDWPEVIGTVCLWEFSPTGDKADIGYEMHPDFQGLGYMREAAQAVVKYGFQELNLKYIDGIMQSANQPSRRLLEKLDFQFVKVLENEEKFAHERSIEMVLYRLDKKDWEEKARSGN